MLGRRTVNRDDAHLPPAVPAMSRRRARERQAAYAAQRRAWAEAVGRPYTHDSDPRPPPGELDADADE